MGNSKSNRVTDVRLRALFFAFAFAFAAFALGGCAAAQNETQASDQQMANRQYMAQVNQKMESLTERLSGFSDAVSRGDVVTMRTQADNAFKVIEGLSGIDVPSDFKEIQQDYVDGCASLKDALNAYIDLYTEIENATESQPFDYATYDERLKAIQGQYDAGIEKLKSADKKASEMK